MEPYRLRLVQIATRKEYGSTAVPPEMDFEPVPLPDQADEPGTRDADAPSARSDPSTNREKKTEGAGKD
ncbi:hypothetical protein CN168_04390 [Sinorhizobium medicae]|nr:hypothetical protein CN168_04390 [Sinorhizobium medicae]